MALSQKHSGKIFVPWFNSHEWRYVYSLIYSEDSTTADKEKAVQILQIWKVRMPILFAGLEGTLIILNAMLYDKNKFTKEQLSSFYALAIMRFLNLCAANSDQQGTFFRIAKEKNLPEWLVSIRHDLAHSQKYSSLFMLQRGIEYCFEWLKHEYWELQDREIIDFMISEVVIENIEENIHLYCEYVNSKISGEKLSSTVISMLKSLNLNKCLTPKEVLEKILQGNKLTIEKAVDVIIENDYLLVGITGDAEKISNSHIKEWESLIQYLHEHDMLMKLIKKLNYVCANNEDLYAQRVYSFWLKEILTGLITKTNEYQYTKVRFDDQTIKLQPPNDNFLIELKEFVDGVLETPHPYLKNYSSCLMTLCAYKQTFAEDLHNLLEEYFNAHIALASTYIPMTVEDVKQTLGINTIKEINSTLEHPPPKRHKRWSRIDDIDDYEGCPLGVLPHQNRGHNPTMTF